MADDEKTPIRHAGLKLEARQTEQGDHVQIGTTIEGAWFALGSLPTPAFEADLQAAADAKAEAASSSSSKK